MLFIPTLVAAALTGLSTRVSGAAVDLGPLSRRQTDPAPGSSVRIDFACREVIVPDPVAGSWSGTSSSIITMTNPDGSTTAPMFCRGQGYCIKDCRFDSPFLPAGPVGYVQACFNPIGGTCNLSFEYNGATYSSDSGSPDGHCGVTGGPKPFSTDEDAVCYIA